MDKNTLSNYGWIVIAVLVLSVMIALATPFGEYVENAVWSATEGLFDTSENALNIIGATAKKDSNYDDLPIFVNNIDECTNTSKKYVLPDGYIYSYVADGVKTEKIYPNLFDPAKATLNARIRSTGEIATEPYTGGYVSDFIEIDLTTASPYIVRLPNDIEYLGYPAAVNLFDENKSMIGTQYYLFDSEKIANNVGVSVFVDENGSHYCTLDYYHYGNNGEISIEEDVIANAKYVRFGLFENYEKSEITYSDIEDVVITCDEIYTTKTVEQGGHWKKTEQYIPADWHSEVLSTANTVSQLKGNSNVIQFLTVSDMHYNNLGVKESNTVSQRNKNIGKVSAEVMRRNEIPFFMNLGDVTGVLTVEEYKENDIIDVVLDEFLAPINRNNILLTVGNHDGVGNTTIDGTYYHYRCQLNNEERARVFFDWQKENKNKHFGKDGTYYYIDDTNTKTRYIMLNSYWNIWQGDESNKFTTDVNDSFFHNPMFGEEQMKWFANEALDMPKNYSAVIGTHSVNPDKAPPTDLEIFRNIISAHCNKTAYSGSYTGKKAAHSYSISVDFSDYNGELIAMFGGHNHVDIVNTTYFEIPFIQITSAGATPYDTDGSERVLGTSNETAIDVVTINKDTRTIHLTRLGCGEDRQVKY